jgi:hypothetical protein
VFRASQLIEFVRVTFEHYQANGLAREFSRKIDGIPKDAYQNVLYNFADYCSHDISDIAFFTIFYAEQYWHFHTNCALIVSKPLKMAKIINVLLNKGETMIFQIFSASIDHSRPTKFACLGQINCRHRSPMLLLHCGLQVRAAVLYPGYIP